jgi:hypothetical protein
MKYQIQHNSEPLENGEFDSLLAAIDAVSDLENSLGWRGLCVVAKGGPYYNLSGRLLTGDDANMVVFVGRGV